MIVDVVLFIILLYLLWWFLLAKPSKFPPGPPNWPIVGSFYYLQKWGPFLYQSTAVMKKHYGDVVGFYVGTTPVVLVSGLDAIKELSFRDDLAGRPKLIMHKVLKEVHGILFTSGEMWKEQRRFTLRHLRDFGFGKSSMESITIEEIESVFNEIDKSLIGKKPGEWSKTIIVHDILGPANINILWHILAGVRFNFSDPYLKKLLRFIKDNIAQAEFGGTIEFAFPGLVKMFPYLTNIRERYNKVQEILEFFQTHIDEHKTTHDPDNPRDFMDVYLTEMNKRKKDPNSTFTDVQLREIGGDLFFAGYDTTFNTIVFSILYMILNPGVQKKVQEELDSVIGKDRHPSFHDRDSHLIPYNEATVMEILRSSTVVPMAVPHAPLLSMRDTEFRGYVIPKDSTILLNLHQLHHDPEIWGDPENFRPERFISPDGKVIRHEAYMPFGVGKRSCLGEALARNNVFLFFACLMQRYSIRVPEGEPMPSKEPVGNITIMPSEFKIQVCLRE
ncbi:methyl farnesoate epoxidase-like [Ischnura elegans]|uniref:methyl farnesoate epoxidase-like n=1 Tax=Ischnura elegans TaxID=197161 RepID=UPI001ED8ADAD|nr:methyl farnesoate epoxidase-like [Ischnura elegans]XP_046394971.1 methyl farnesoate epoxidase-like [Ischnura elegans]XP_046394972.1 methyl farnesoate epoxidase-like [Ischnura elegans]XP_046394973.1 methyl farnesoate epoxidase-like [Ischnura elegans]